MTMSGCHFTWLPLPRLSFPYDVAQTGEGEVKGKHQGLLICSSLQKPASGGYNLLGRKISACTPFWLLQMDGVKYRIRDAQQLLTS